MGQKWRKIVAVLLIVALAAGVLVIYYLLPPNPLYAGRRLSFWLQGYINPWGPPPFPSLPTKQAADYALKAIGTNALPRLLEMLQAQDSPLKTNFISWFEHHSSIKIPYTASAIQNQEAFWGFEALGPESRAPAVPDLIKIYGQCTWYSRRAILTILGGVGPPAKDAVPFLLRALTNGNEIIRCDAACSLGWLHSQPALAVPALMKALNDPAPNVRGGVATALGEYGKDALPAVPALLKLLLSESTNYTPIHVSDARPIINSSNPNLRTLAIYIAWALDQIDPDGEVREKLKQQHRIQK